MEPIIPTANPEAESDMTFATRGHIVSTPDTCGGKPRIAGSRIPVKHVAIMHERRCLHHAPDSA